MFGKWMLNPSFGASYRNSNYNNYYYGVRSHEVTASRESYMPTGSWAYSLSNMTGYSFNDDWSLNFILSHTILGGQVDSSPTTKKDYETTAVLGFSYNVL
jgi:outer membrane protein